MKTKSASPRLFIRWIILLIFTCSISIIFHHCNNEEITDKPLVSTNEITFTQTSAIVGGEVTGNGGSPVTDYGIYWGTSANPESTGTKLSIGSGTGSFSISLTGLSTSTLYYIKAYAVNDAGEAFGSEVSFTTLDKGTGTLADIEGNTYSTVIIGTQEWMAENLKTTMYNDNTPIPLVTDATVWSNLTTPAYSWYDNDEATYGPSLGVLYNWYGIATDKLCPTDWHVPTDEEWKILEIYLGMSRSDADLISWRGTDQGTKLKTTSGWHDHGNGTDDFGFAALPSGYRDSKLGTFNSYERSGWWWSSSTDFVGAWSRALGKDRNGSIGRQNLYLRYGFSVRCLMD